MPENGNRGREPNREQQEIFASGETYAPLVFDFGMLNRFFSAFSRRDRLEAELALKEIFAVLDTQPEADPITVKSIYCALWCLVDPAVRESPLLRNLRWADPMAMLQSMLTAQVRASITGGRSLFLESFHEADRPEREPGATSGRTPRMEARAEAYVGNATVERVMRLIGEQYGNKELTVGSLAKQVYLTPTYLSWLFKKETGKTIGQFMTEIRIERSMELLMDKQLPISRVSELVGYSAADYLTKVFKHHVGMTPSEFRNRHLT